MGDFALEWIYKHLFSSILIHPAIVNGERRLQPASEFAGFSPRLFFTAEYAKFAES